MNPATTYYYIMNSANAAKNVKGDIPMEWAILILIIFGVIFGKLIWDIYRF